jgi:hypothetical protein
MNLPYTKEQILKTITVEGENAVSSGNLVSIFWLFDTGMVDRKMAWQIIKMVHDGDLECPLAVYGTLTVFSLSKDLEQFKQMYSQGCDMLDENNVCTKDEKKIMKKNIKDVLDGKKDFYITDDNESESN